MDIQFEIQNKIEIHPDNIERYIAQGVDTVQMELLYTEAYANIMKNPNRNIRARELLTLKQTRKQIDHIKSIQDENLIIYG